MKISRRKLFALFAIVSMLIVGSGLMALSANAVAVPNRKTAAFMSVAPRLIGLGQQLTCNPWIAPGPSGPSFYAQEVPRLGYLDVTVTFTRPDGSKDTFMPTDPALDVAGMTESGGWMYFYYTPNQVGTWSATFSFPGQTFTTPPSPDTVYYEPSTSQPFTFIVQQDKVVESGLLTGWPWSPLPTGYWQRPVNVNNREWSAISGEWPLTGHDAWLSKFNPYSTAPNTAHIVWDNQVTQGGIVGGEWGSLSYSGFGGHPGIILDGKVYYNDYAGGTFSCRDLRTGELLYRATGSVSGAQNLRLAQGWGGVAGTSGTAPIISTLWSFSGSAPGFAEPATAAGSATWKRYDPMTGALMQTITDAPTSVVATWYENGNPVFYVVQRWGWNTTIPLGFAGVYLIKWDFSRLWGTLGAIYGVLDNNWRNGIVWNVTLRQPDGTAPADGRRGLSVYAFEGANVLVVKANTEEDMLYGYDITTGQRLWAKNAGFITMRDFMAGPSGPIWSFDTVTSTYTAWDVKTGNKLWTTDVIGEYPWGAQAAFTFAVAYDTFYVYHTDGRMYAIDLTNGKTKWKSDSIGDTTETIYGTWPSFNIPAITLGGGAGGYNIGPVAVADGKIYFSTGVSWGTQPYSRFHKLWAMDANTGEFLWNVTGSFSIDSIAEGYLVAVDGLNGILYTFGKGKTATTVSAPNVAVPKGTGVLVQGTVMDMSPAQLNTPAVAAESMTEWMEYLHMQNATLNVNPPTPKGVPVQLYAIDSNGNAIDLGTVTTNSYGQFSTIWTPPNIDKYTIAAYFAGDDSYWSSSAATALATTAAPTTTENGAGQPVAAADNTLIIVGTGIAVIIAVAVATVLILRKKQ